MESSLNTNTIKNINFDIKFSKDLVKDSFSFLWLSHTFVVFKSINNIFFLIYATESNSIISLDIIIEKKINEVKKAHQTFIDNFRHYLDMINNRDLILSISSDDNNVKIWNINNFECILDLKKIYKIGYLPSACFIKNKKENYIITINNSSDIDIMPESIKVFDFEGNKIKEINNSNLLNSFIEVYYDIKESKNYVISCTKYYSISYDYNENKIYHKYSDNNCPRNIIIINKEKSVEMIESCFFGNIRIWDFHSGLLLKKINISTFSLREICLWDNNYLFVGCDDKSIKLIEYNQLKLIKEYKGHKNKVISIKKINHPKYGNCLLSQGAKSDKIKLWMIK